MPYSIGQRHKKPQGSAWYKPATTIARFVSTRSSDLLRANRYRCCKVPSLSAKFAGYDVRPAEERDVEACNKLCREVHGFDRDRELRDAIRAQSANVVEHLDEITGYATAIGFLAHAVARTNQDLKALIGAATEFPGPGFLLPTRNHEVFQWCLSCELKLVFQMTLMSIGLYNEPAGAYLPSILY